MSLLADLDAARTSHRGRVCELWKWLESRTEEERTAVRAKVGCIPDQELAEIITKNGHPISSSTIAVHRRDECLTCRSSTT